jgi:hypothetical protein
MPKHERAVSDLDDGKSKCARHHTAEEREISCVTIQRFWTHKLAVEATKYGMTSEIAKALPFVDLLSSLRDTTKVNVMKCIVQRIYSLTRFDMQENKIVNIRVFLAAFMIAYHPAQVFERTTNLEVALCEAAVNMLKVFDVMCTDIANSTRGSCLRETCEKARTFPSVLHDYLDAFQAWKLPDEVKLTERIQHALDALAEAQGHLIESDADTPRFRIEFATQQTRLRLKLLKIVGVKAFESLDAIRMKKDVAHALVLTKLETGVSSSVDGYTARPKRMTNEGLAHELLLDPNFILDQRARGENPVHAKIRHSFHVTPQPLHQVLTYFCILHISLRLVLTCFNLDFAGRFLEVTRGGPSARPAVLCASDQSPRGDQERYRRSLEGPRIAARGFTDRGGLGHGVHKDADRRGGFRMEMLCQACCRRDVIPHVLEPDEVVYVVRIGGTHRLVDCEG